MSSELDAALARAYGVLLDTSAWVPASDAEPETLLRAAEQIGGAIGTRPSAPLVERAWAALPARAVVAPSPDQRRVTIERALAWARAEGASWDGIEVHVDDSGNAAMRTSRPLAAGEQVLVLPRRLMIVSSDVVAARGVAARDVAARDDAAVRDVAARDVTAHGAPEAWLGTGAPPRDVLAVWLAFAVRDPGSRSAAYLATLPTALPELPKFRANLDELAGTMALALAVDGNRELRDAYAALPVGVRERVPLADFAWGCAIVRSRGFHAPGSVEHRIALIPVVDLFDHRLGDTTWDFDPSDGNFVISTERAFAAGEPIGFTYGDHGNAQLLVHYGFTEPDNVACEAGLLFERSADPVVAVASYLLWNVPLDAPSRMRIGTVFDHRFLRVLSFARLHAASPDDRARAADGLAAYGDIPWLGVTVETKALDLLAAAARSSLAALDSHPTAPGAPPTLDPTARGAPDGATRSTLDPTASGDGWGRSCALVREGERAVLEQLLAFARDAMPLVREADPKRLRAVSAEAIDSPRLYRQYLLALADAMEA